MRQCFRERFAWDINAEHLGGNPGHDVGRESQPADVERRIARRLAAERIEMRGEVAEISVRPDERIGGGDIFEVLDFTERFGGPGAWGLGARGCNCDWGGEVP